MKTNKEMKSVMNSLNIVPKVELKNEPDKATVYLYGEIVEEVPTDWFFGDRIEGDFIVPQDVRDMFEEIGEEKDVEIHLNSRGGDVYASVAISNFLRDRNNNISIYVDAIAASGASIIAMSADNLYMYENSMMMIHRASTIAWGNTEDFEKIANDLKKFDEVVLNSYTGRFKGSVQELKDMIADETFLTASECLTLGLTDEVVENKKKKEEETVENKQSIDVKVSLLEKFKTKETVKPSVKQNILNKFKGEK